MNTLQILSQTEQEQQPIVVQFPNKSAGMSMQNTRPQPMVESYVDLRDFAYMPLDVVRFRDSDFTATVGGEAFRAGVMLWCAAWHQVPAGSLPNDNRVLANLAGYGRFIEEWQKVSEGALYGWVLCSDDRFYHPTIAEKATESFESKREHQYKRFYDRMRKSNLKLQGENKPIQSIPSFQDWMAANCPKDWVSPIPTEIRRNSKTVPQNDAGIPKQAPRNSNGNPQLSNGKSEFSNGIDNNSNGNTQLSAGIPQNSTLNRREYKGIYNSSSCSSAAEISKINLGAARYFPEDAQLISFDQLLQGYNAKQDFIETAKSIREFHNVTDQQIQDAWNIFEPWAVQAQSKTAHKWLITFLSKFVQDAVHNKTQAKRQTSSKQAELDVNAAWKNVDVTLTRGQVKPVPLPEDLV